MMNQNTEIRDDLLTTVDGLSYEQLNKEIEPGRWTIMQVLDHLYLMERTIVKGMYQALDQKEMNPTTEKPIHLTSNRDHKVEAPPYTVPTKEPMSLEDMKKRLATSRRALEELESSVDEEKMLQHAFPHPIFGLISVKQWIPFIGFHEKRHLDQILELKEKL